MVLCDDAAAMRELSRYGLEADGTIDVVGDAEDARGGILRTRELRPDAILLDLSMPGMDGLDALPRIRDAAPCTAIVVFSGFSAERLAPTALALGADRYIEKGEGFAALRNAVLDACAERRAGM